MYSFITDFFDGTFCLLLQIQSIQNASYLPSQLQKLNSVLGAKLAASRGMKKQILSKSRIVLSQSLFLRASLLWVGFCVLAFMNGAFREVTIKKLLGVPDPAANQISCLTGVALWTLFLTWNWKRLSVSRFSQAVNVGVGWFISTFIFETFILGRKSSWSEIMATYDVSSGQYWALVLLWIGILPLGFFLLQNTRHTNKTEMGKVYNFVRNSSSTVLTPLESPASDKGRADRSV